MRNKRGWKWAAPLVAVMAGVVQPAHADIVGMGGGSYDQVPLYRALTFGTVNFTSDSARGGIGGIDYVSNVAPLPVARSNVNINAHGASFQGVGVSAYSGFYAGRNYASINVSNANAGDSYYQVAGQGSATSVQFFSADAAAAYATFTWHVSGSSSNASGVGQTSCPTPVPPPGCFPPATGRLDFGASTDANVNWLNLFDDPGNALDSITRFGPGTYSYNLPIGQLGDVIKLFYWSSAYTQVNAGEAPAGGSFSLTADYFSTFLLEDVELFDASGTAIAEWEMRDLNLGETVFNQDGRLAGIDPPPDLTPVPEPASLAMAALALAALGLSRRRKA